LCGHGYFDMQAYDDYKSGKLLPYEYPQEKVNEAMKGLKKLYPWLNGELKDIK
jgi:tryptophan synthase beta chain